MHKMKIWLGFYAIIFPFSFDLATMSVHDLTKTTLLVAFDTIFEQCSLAIMADEQVIYEKTTSGGRGQTEIILPMLDEALQTTGISLTQVTAWAFNRGPGSFSGIRINTAVIQALSVANDAPCIGISSLHALAFMAYEQENAAEGMSIAAVMDARQNQVYAGDFVVYEGELITKGESLLEYEESIVADVVVGDGVDLVRTDAKRLRLNPSAKHIARLAYPLLMKGQSVTAEHALPVYLRNNAWKTLAEQSKDGKKAAKLPTG